MIGGRYIFLVAFLFMGGTLLYSFRHEQPPVVTDVNEFMQLRAQLKALADQLQAQMDSKKVPEPPNELIKRLDEKVARLEARLLDGGSAVTFTLPTKPKPEPPKLRPVDQWQFYSQQSEDAVLLHDVFWKNGKALVNGVFLEVGALDGKTYSNTLAFERELGWSGILIEGCPDYAKQLEKNRPSPSVIKVAEAICDWSIYKDRAIPISVPCSPMSGAAGHGDKFMRNAHKGSEMISVPCSPISELITRTKIDHIDLMSVDVGGFELPLLKTMDFKRINVRVVLIEVDHNSPDELKAIRELMTAAGFETNGLCCGQHADEIWVNPNYRNPAEKWEAVPWSAHATAVENVWRARPCQIVPMSQIETHLTRDKDGASTEFADYVKSFHSPLFNCSDPIIVFKPDARFSTPEARLQIAKAELEKGADYSPVICETQGQKWPLYPINFGIFSELLRSPPWTNKTAGFAPQVPGRAYAYGEEEQYHLDYAKSYYGITMKKGGWDCYRHWEILASGTAPFFLQMEYMPVNTMRGFPRNITESIMSLPGVSLSFVPEEKKWCCPDIRELEVDFNVFPKEEYAILNGILNEFVSRWSTTKAVAQSMLNVTGNGAAKRVVMFLDRLDCCTPNQSGYHLPVDYIDLAVLHGFKDLMGTQFETYPRELDFMYSDFPKKKLGGLYGRGFSYGRRLDPSLKTPMVTADVMTDRLTQGYYDVVIYGVASNAGKPLFGHVTNAFKENPSAVFHLNGDDTLMPYPLKYVSCISGGAGFEWAKLGHSYFKREM